VGLSDSDADADRYPDSVEEVKFRMLNMIKTYAQNARSIGEREEGQGLVEYALILSLVSVVSFAALQLLGNNISDLLNTVAGQV
jgi:Flp pilus assembly pilin Flp